MSTSVYPLFFFFSWYLARLFSLCVSKCPFRVGESSSLKNTNVKGSVFIHTIALWYFERNWLVKIPCAHFFGDQNFEVSELLVLWEWKVTHLAPHCWPPLLFTFGQEPSHLCSIGPFYYSGGQKYRLVGSVFWEKHWKLRLSNAFKKNVLASFSFFLVGTSRPAPRCPTQKWGTSDVFWKQNCVLRNLLSLWTQVSARKQLRSASFVTRCV